MNSRSALKNKFIYLNDGIRNFGTGNDGVRAHHSVGIFLADLGDQESTHTSTSTTTK